MANATDSLAASTTRPLALCMRADLIVHPQRYQGRCYWVVKDPVALKYYRFEEEEFAILEMLDGRASLAEIQQAFEQRFRPQKIRFAELHRLVTMLHRNSLVISERAGQGRQLVERGVEHRRKRRLAAFTNILSIRFKGVDPDRFLTWLDGRCGWLFSLPALCVWLAVVLAAGLLVLVQLDVMMRRLPAFHEFFALHNCVWLAIVLAATKVLHELGHGLSCKRFGGECHEMGVMLLVMTPCLYCNVSDSWMLPGKWRRTAIGAAGMYVELGLASLATFLWWFTGPGMLNYLALNVVFVCSASTVLFNANPLMRYDGYYILSDLLEIPNLRQKATAILHRKLGVWMLGLPEKPDPFLPQRRQGLFAAYSMAAAVYRWFVSFSILWFLNRVFEPYGLQVIGRLIALVAIYGLLVQPLWQLSRFLAIPGRIERVKKLRLATSVAVLLVAGSAVVFVPLPFHVSCPVVVQPRQATNVYVEVPGRLAEIHAAPGARVETGQPLIRLVNLDLDLDISRQTGERRREAIRLANLRQQSFADHHVRARIAQTEKSLEELDERIQRLHDERGRLTVAAARGGVVISPVAREPERSERGTLPAWSGRPLDPKNRDAFLREGVVVCQIADPHRVEAILEVDQTDIDFVGPGLPVTIVLPSLPGCKFTGRIEHVAQSKRERSRGSASTSATHQTSYFASVPLDSPRSITTGTTGEARIRSGRQSVGRRVWRYLCRTFQQ